MLLCELFKEFPFTVDGNNRRNQLQIVGNFHIVQPNGILFGIFKIERRKVAFCAY